MNSRRLVGGLLILAFAAATSWGWSSLHHKEESPSRWMSDVMISRAGIEDVKTFDDESYIHGLKFFFFKTNNREKFIDWLGLRRRTEIPKIFKERFKYLESQVHWQFDWSRSEIYSIYYCNGEGQDWTVDLIMVNGNNVIYMTSGYKSASAVKTDDYESCHPKTK